jgi:hypothetical protein
MFMSLRMMSAVSEVARSPKTTNGGCAWRASFIAVRRCGPGKTLRRWWSMAFQSKAQRTFSLKCENAN